MQDLESIERNADAAARAYARAPADPVGALAAEIERTADAVRARLTGLDLGDIACSDDLAALVRAGRLDDAGREFARLVAQYCTEGGAVMQHAIIQLALLVTSAACWVGGIYCAAQAVLAWRNDARCRVDLPLQWHHADLSECDDLDRIAARLSGAAQVRS